MPDPQPKKRKRLIAEKPVSSRDNASKRLKSRHHIARTQAQSNMSYRSRRKPVSARLPRPKHPVTFSLPEHLISLPSTDTAVPVATKRTSKSAQSGSSTPTTNTAVTPYIRLSKTQLLLTRIHHRNKNQHRAQLFYKHLNLLRRALSRLIKLYKPIASQKPVASTPLSAEQTRQSFERQAELRSQREVLESWIREILVPGCYVAFSSLVADTQFANLGVMLMGCLADVVGVVGVMRTVEKVPAPPTKKTPAKVDGTGDTSVAAVEGWSTMVTGPDVGVVVRRVYEGSDREAETNPERTAGDLGVAVERHHQDPGGEHVMTSLEMLFVESDPGEPFVADSDADRVSSPPIDWGSPMGSGASSDTDTRAARSAELERYDISDMVSWLDDARSKPKPAVKPDSANEVVSASGNGVAATASSLNDTGLGETRARHGDRPKAKGGRKRIETDTGAAPSQTQPRPEAQGTEHKDRKKKKKKKGNAIDDLFSGF